MVGTDWALLGVGFVVGWIGGATAEASCWRRRRRARTMRRVDPIDLRRALQASAERNRIATARARPSPSGLGDSPSTGAKS